MARGGNQVGFSGELFFSNEPESEMANQLQRPAFVAAATLTAGCLFIAGTLAVLSPDPAPALITRVLDAAIYISIAGALTIFGLLGYMPGNRPPDA